MLRIAICDDDARFAAGVEEMVRNEAMNAGIRAETEAYTDGSLLLGDLEKGYRYDLIYIDIEMEKVDGIETARRIRRADRSVLFIYVSGYDQYLKELFEVEPFRYLSKPLDRDMFRRYFAEACRRIGETEEYYQFSFNKGIRKVALREVAYFESSGRLINISLSDGRKESFYGKLGDVEKELEKSRLYFLRIHQSFLVNYDYIERMNFTDITISLAGAEKELKISEDRQKEVRKQLCAIASGKAVAE